MARDGPLDLYVGVEETSGSFHSNIGWGIFIFKLDEGPFYGPYL